MGPVISDRRTVLGVPQSLFRVGRSRDASCLLSHLLRAPQQRRRRSAAGSSTASQNLARVLPHVRLHPPGEACGAVARQRPAHARSLNAERHVTAGQRVTRSSRPSRASVPHVLLTCGCGCRVASVFPCSGWGRARHGLRESIEGCRAGHHPVGRTCTVGIDREAEGLICVSARVGEPYALGAARQSNVLPVRMITEPASVHWSGIAPNTESSISAA